jgi:hypothetical protein
MTTNLMPKNAEKFVCEKCDFKCYKLSNYNTHILTLKHKILQNTTEKNAKNAEYICHCNKVYKHHSSLWNHKKKCNFIKEKTNEEIEQTKTDENIDIDLSDKSLILTLIQQNNELQKQMLEVIKNGTNNTNNIINNNNNSNNKSFNLNLFLNETCKNAMNIMDFVDSIKIQLCDIESIGELGYVNGMSKLIIKHLNALDENMRPIHCSDPKRESLYVKDQNVWEKEDPDNKKIKKAIKYISHKNICALPEWKAKYPDCIYSDSLKSDQYNHIVIEAMGGSGDNDAEKADKIVKKIAKAVTIDKN